MKTDELISMLARQSQAEAAPAAGRRSTLALVVGVAVAALAMQLELGVRPDLAAAMLLPMFWIKLMFPAAIALIMLHATLRLARPGGQARLAPWLIMALLALLWLMAARTLFTATPAARGALLFGTSWRDCLINIPLLSLPMLVAAFYTVRQFAPTRPAVAGAAAGLLAAGVGATVYAFHCPELEAPFLAAWYVAGMALPTIAGALAGPRLLHW